MASDVLLLCAGAPSALPAVLARRVARGGQALLLNALRGAQAQLTLGEVKWNKVEREATSTKCISIEFH